MKTVILLTLIFDCILGPQERMASGIAPASQREYAILTLALGDHGQSLGFCYLFCPDDLITGLNESQSLIKFGRSFQLPRFQAGSEHLQHPAEHTVLMWISS